MTSPAPVRGLVALLRLPYWLMTGGLSLLTAFAIAKNPLSLSLESIFLIFFSMAFITSAGFAINDFFDRESDAIIKPKRPLPSGSLTLKQVVAISGVLFGAGLIMALFINWLSFAIIGIDSAVLVAYSMLVKRKSGFVANIVVGVLTGTAFLYGEATISSPPIISIISMSLYPIAMGTVGGNVLRDVLSLEGDSKSGYPTLPQKIGVDNSAKVAAGFFLLTGLFAPLPFVVGNFNVYYLLPILVWSALLIYSAVRLATVVSNISNVRKYERVVTMSMILLPLALILQAASHAVGGL